MKKKSELALILIFFLNLFLCHVNSGNGIISASTFMTEIEKMGKNQFEEGIDKGVSGAFAGYLAGHLVVAGGCNFPVNPLGANSEKKYYQGIYEINYDSENPTITRRIGSLPIEMAYGSAVNCGESLVIVGGSNADKSFSDVFKLSLDSKGDLVTEILPPLPAPTDNFGLTKTGSRIYLAGGNIEGIPSNGLYMLDMEDLQKGWQKLQPFPGNPRVQPIVEASKDNQGEDCIYVWGGFAGKGEGREATLNTDGYKYNIKRKTWSDMTSPLNNDKEEVSLGGGASAVLKDGRIVVTGGVNKDVFLGALKNQPKDYLTHPVEWYQFNNRLLIFNPATEEWEEVGEDNRMARAGANLLVLENNEVILVGGELKPRIRTFEIFKTKID